MPSASKRARRQGAAPRNRHRHFDPFGQRLDPLNPEITRVGFTGQDHDNDLGLIDIKGRVYDPLAGRFMTADPVMQAPFWSQGLNRYSYVFNNPINNVDPSGFMANGGESTTTIMGWGGAVTALAAGGGYGLGIGALNPVTSAFLPSIGGGSPGSTQRATAPSGAPKASGAGRETVSGATGQLTGMSELANAGYPTAWEAARGALERYNPASIMSKDPADPLSYGDEYGGLIYEHGGRYFFTEAVCSELQGHVDPWEALSQIPSDARNRVVGDYHTHGGPNPIADARIFQASTTGRDQAARRSELGAISWKRETIL